MAIEQMKQAAASRFEGKLRAVGRQVSEDPEWEKAHYTIPGKENPRAQAVNRAADQARKKKTN